MPRHTYSEYKHAYLGLLYADYIDYSWFVLTVFDMFMCIIVQFVKRITFLSFEFNNIWRRLDI